MKKIFLRVLFVSLFFLTSFSQVFAQASDVQELKKQVQDLNQTVQNLTKMVESQNKRIDELSSGTAVVADKKVDETQTLLNELNNAPPAPGADARQLGPWRYSAGGSKAAKLLPDISVIGIMAGAYFTQDPDEGPNSGVVGVDPASTGFTFQELEIALQGAVDPYFRYDAFLSFNQDGVELEEAYFTTQEGLPRGLQFKGGIELLPFGRQNPKHLHAWTFANNNLVNKYLLGADGLAEIGLEMDYLFPTPFFLQFQGTFTNGDNSTSFGGERKGDFLYNGRWVASADLNSEFTFLLGGSLAYGFNNTAPGNATLLYGGDLLLKWKKSAHTSLSWQTEFIGRNMQVPGETAHDGGLYSYLDFQFLKRWHGAFRYDQVGIPQGLQTREFRITPAFAFNPTEFSQIRVQYELDKIRGEDYQQAAILQLMFNLGAHGAHVF